MCSQLGTPHIQQQNKALTKTAAAGAAIKVQNTSICLLFKNCNGNILSSKLVKNLKCCCKPKSIDKTPAVTNNPMVWPLFHAYVVPPKLIAMIPAREAPISRMEPSQSICLARCVKVSFFRGSQRGTKKTKIGAKTPKRTRFM